MEIDSDSIGHVSWLLTDVFDDELWELGQALVHFNIEYLIFPENASFYPFSKEGCVVVRGSLPYCRKTQRETQWVPGPYLDLNKYVCSYYYPRLQPFLLNHDYYLIPYGEVGNYLKGWFVRPNSGFKTFTGGIYDGQSDIHDANLSPEDLVLVSSPKEIFEEWRVVIADGRAVCGSQYSPEILGFCPKWVLEFAQQVADHWCPESCWVADICSTANGPRLVEINSFSAAGLYLCSPWLYVPAVTEAAFKDYSEIYEKALS